MTAVITVFGMARETKTISIQPDLNAKLAKFPNENWSAIACRAFEIRLAEIEQMNTTSTQEDQAIWRIRASKMRAVDQLYRNGEAEGISFVLRHANYLQLERLVKSHERDMLDLESEDCSFAALAHVMSGGDGSESETESLLRQKIGDDIDEPKWLEGFVDGAVRKYEEIGSRIN
jgi:hypothetical protein